MHAFLFVLSPGDLVPEHTVGKNGIISMDLIVRYLDLNLISFFWARHLTPRQQMGL